MSSSRKLSESQAKAAVHNDAVASAESSDCVVISACLLGRACRYDGDAGGSAALRLALAALEAQGARIVGVCPEELGGLGTPRAPASMNGGDGADVWAGRAHVRRNHDGHDVTAAFVRGAQLARAAAGALPPNRAILKARSPSCGVGRSWQDGGVRDGDGVFAALLRAEGVALSDDEDFVAAARPTPAPSDGDPQR